MKKILLSSVLIAILTLTAEAKSTDTTNVPSVSKTDGVIVPVVGGAIVDITATAILATGYRATKLIGSDIYNEVGDNIGTIDDFIIGSDNSVSFAVISVGGFLGMGDRLVAVPASLFTSNDKGQVVFPNGKKDDLKALPEFRYTE